MRLLHYSDQPLLSVHSVEQVGGMAERGNKPNGLWVSVEGEDDWKSWCESEDFSTNSMNAVTEVVLAENSNVLVIETSAALLAFHDEFRALSDPPRFSSIRWPDVAAMYDGIIIAPYRWDHRLDGVASNWYYSWDCASGCLWNARAIYALKHNALKAA